MPKISKRYRWVVLLGLASIVALVLVGRWMNSTKVGGQGPAEPFRIAGNLYYVGATDVAAFLITGPEGHIVLDGGYPTTAPMIIASISKLGFSIKDVRVLLNSEAHPDHAGGLGVLKKESGAELIVFPEMIDTGYSMPAIQKHATSWKEGAVPRLQEMAKQLSLAIVAGVSDRDGSHIYNSQVFIDAGGSILAKYRKTHLVTGAIGRAPGLHSWRPICELQLQQLPSRPHDLLRSSVPGSLPRPHTRTWRECVDQFVGLAIPASRAFTNSGVDACHRKPKLSHRR